MSLTGKRLQHLQAMAAGHYDHIWDCCCDHGYLGQSLMHTSSSAHIHFVDIVPELIEALNSELSKKNAGDQWSTHCQDAAFLPLNRYTGHHLIILAGIGGDLTGDIVTRLYKQFADLPVTFLLCPVYHEYKLRQQLRQMGFKRENEALIRDKGRFYEILKVQTPVFSARDLPLLSEVGDKIWQCDHPADLDNAKAYLSLKLRHYRRMQYSSGFAIDPIIKAYEHVQNQLLDTP